MYKQVKVRKSKVKVFVLPTAVSISRMIWNLSTYLIILQTQKKKNSKQTTEKKEQEEKGKRKRKKQLSKRYIKR